MFILKYALRVLSSAFLHFSLLVSVCLVCFVLILSDRSLVKGILVESNIYREIVPAIIAENKKTNSLPLDDIELASIAQQVFSDQVLRSKSEIVIDSLYDWLEGKKSTIGFTVDFSAERKQFLDQVADYAVTRVNTLPVCGQSAVLELDVFKTTCQPEVFDSAALYNLVRDDLENSGFLEKSYFDERDVLSTTNNRSVGELYSYVPRLFQIAKNGIAISAILLIIAAGFYILVRSPRRYGIQSLGRDLVSNGILIMLSVWLFVFAIPRFTDNYNLASEGLSGVINDLYLIVSRKFALVLITVELVLVLAGLMCLIFEKMTKRSSVYAGIVRKSGVMSNIKKPKRSASLARSTPPIQTSEGTSAVKKSKKNTAKYRKLKI